MIENEAVEKTLCNVKFPALQFLELIDILSVGSFFYTIYLLSIFRAHKKDIILFVSAQPCE